jgi:ABC-type multidrug transport system fused ATPase/permease subunit
MVTHRLNAVRDVELMFVRERGRIVEQGTHDDLIAADGVYAYLLGLQYVGQATT